MVLKYKFTMSAPPPYYPANPGHQGGYQAPQAYQPGPYPVTTPPQPGYAPSYHEGAPPGYQPLPTQVPPTTYVYIRGNCPACHTGILEDSFTALGVCLAICFFPLGLICCMMLTEKRCNRCGMSFS